MYGSTAATICILHGKIIRATPVRRGGTGCRGWSRSRRGCGTWCGWRDRFRWCRGVRRATATVRIFYGYVIRTAAVRRGRAAARGWIGYRAVTSRGISSSDVIGTATVLGRGTPAGDRTVTSRCISSGYVIGTAAVLGTSTSTDGGRNKAVTSSSISSGYVIRTAAVLGTRTSTEKAVTSRGILCSHVIGTAAVFSSRTSTNFNSRI